MYALNIAMQSIFTLLISAGVFVGIAYLLASRAGVGDWVYIPAVIIGLGIGVLSMVKFVYSAMLGLERLEQQREKEGNKTAKGGGDTDERL